MSEPIKIAGHASGDGTFSCVPARWVSRGGGIPHDELPPHDCAYPTGWAHWVRRPPTGYPAERTLEGCDPPEEQNDDPRPR